MRFQPGFRYGASVAVLLVGAEYLLTGETDGYAIDATTYDSVTAAAYVGGPVGGTVATIDTGTPANDLSNVPLDASNLTQSGTSPKMVHHAASPYVRWSAHNLVLQSQTFATTWSNLGVATASTVTNNSAVAPDGTTTADTLDDVGSSLERTAQQINTTVGLPYTWSVYLKQNTSQFAGIQADSGTGSAGTLVVDLSNGTSATLDAGSFVGTYTVTDAGSGWYRLSIAGLAINTVILYKIFPAYAASLTTTSAGATTGSVYAWGAQMNRGMIPTPYIATTTAARIGIPLSYDAAAAQYGILVEPAATNICLRSEEFGTTWAESGSGDGSVTSNSVAAPDGTTTADTFNTGTDNGLQQNITVSASTTYTASVYMKYIDDQWVIFQFTDQTPTDRVRVWFDVQNGVVGSNATTGSGAYVSSSITAIGNGWYRCTVTGSISSTSGRLNIIPAVSDGVFSIGANKNVYLWGAQLELGSVATSYIPTLGSTVTRAVDNIEAPTSTTPYSQTAGTAYVDMLTSGVATPATNQAFMQIDDDSGIAERFVFYRSTANNPTFQVIDGSDQATIDAGTMTASTRHQMASAWAANDFAATIDGGAVVTDVAGTLPTVTTFRLGNSVASDRPFGGHIMRLVWVPRRVVDGDLPTWRYNF
jgi:hypothetical protein